MFVLCSRLTYNWLVSNLIAFSVYIICIIINAADNALDHLVMGLLSLRNFSATNSFVWQLVFINLR